MQSDDEDGFRAQLGRRIGEAAERYRTKTAAAEAAGISPDQLARWIAGTSKVPVEGLWGLARGADIDFAWLCTGVRPEPAPVTPLRPVGQRGLQEPVLRDVLAALATVTVEEGVCFAPEKIGDLVFDLHDYVIDQRARDGAAAADLPGIARLVSRAAQSKR